MRQPWLPIAMVLALVVLAGLPAASEEGDLSPVARVSYVEGDASYMRGDSDDWYGLGPNAPLVTGDSLYAGQGRVEVMLGRGKVLRMDADTDVQLANLAEGILQISLYSGYVDLRVRSLYDDETVEVDTPTAAATIWEPGVYRIWASERADRFGVERGGLAVAVNGEQLDVAADELLVIETGNELGYSYDQLPPSSMFDRWADVRDRQFRRGASRRHVHPDVIGYEDLDRYGDWRDYPEYGYVWVPRVAPGWAPYREGRWIWQDPYGWTWVSYESWGWAPYHYGRWVFVGDSWAWAPPPPPSYHPPHHYDWYRPVYSPALVVWVGGGATVGWFPLGPADPYYHPWEAHGPGPHHDYAYWNRHDSFTVVNVVDFTSAVVKPLRWAADLLRDAPLPLPLPPPILPNLHSLDPFPEHRTHERPVPPAGSERHVVARLVPPPPPIPFSQKVGEIERTGRPIASPVSRGGSVGKPFQPGAKAPEGSTATSALAPERKVTLRPREGRPVQAPRPIQHDVVLPTRSGSPRPAARPTAESQSQAQPGERVGRQPAEHGQPTAAPTAVPAERPTPRVRPSETRPQEPAGETEHVRPAPTAVPAERPTPRVRPSETRPQEPQGEAREVRPTPTARPAVRATPRVRPSETRPQETQGEAREVRPTPTARPAERATPRARPSETRPQETQGEAREVRPTPTARPAERATPRAQPSESARPRPTPQVRPVEPSRSQGQAQESKATPKPAKTRTGSKTKPTPTPAPK